MSRVVEVTAPEYKLHDEGVFYEGTLVAIEDAPDNGYGPQYIWKLALDKDQVPGEEQKTTWYYTAVKLTKHEKSKFRMIVEGILGREVSLGEGLDIDTLVGKRVKVIFKHGKKKDGVTPKEDIIIFKPGTPVGDVPF